MTDSRYYLLVDDNLAFAENLAEILRDQGDEVVVVSSGEEAVQLVQERQFDALVTDMRMPTMSGALLVHSVRRLDPGLPALVVTAYTSDDDLSQARQEGLLAVLPKPVAIDRLLELLAVARRDGLVAVVEDDESLIDNLAEALRDRGLTAVTASSVVETERLGPVAPFAGVVDVCVPGGPAGEAMRKLSQRFPGLPLLAITGFPERVPDEVEAKVYVKPFETGTLIQHLERLHHPGAAPSGGGGGGSAGEGPGLGEEGGEAQSGLRAGPTGQAESLRKEPVSKGREVSGPNSGAQDSEPGRPLSVRQESAPKSLSSKSKLSVSVDKSLFSMDSLMEGLRLVSGDRLRALGTHFPGFGRSSAHPQRTHAQRGALGFFMRLGCSRQAAQESSGGLR